MSCCGGNRGPVQGAVADPRMQAGFHESGVTFEYVGEFGLTVIGGITRCAYVFREPGARVAVDRRDVLSLLSIPVLRRVQ